MNIATPNQVETTIYRTEVEWPFGIITLMATGTHIIHIHFGDAADAEENLNGWLHRYIGKVSFAKGNDLTRQLAIQLNEYFSGDRVSLDVPVQLHGTAFQQAVWRQLTLIPYGQTRSYQQIAQFVGKPSAQRAVGGANHHNPLSIIVPCHRVVGAKQQLVGYAGGIEIKQFLLQHEFRKLS